MNEVLVQPYNASQDKYELTIEFRNTAYYQATMGDGLLKRYWAV